MRKNPFIYRILTLLLVVTFLASCKKDDEVKPATEEDFASAQATVDLMTELDAINSMAMSVYDDYSSTRVANSKIAKARKASARTKEDGICGSVTYSESEASGALTVTVDYGTGTTCEGILLKGKVIYAFDASGSAATISFVNYEADGKKLSGDYSIAVGINEDSENAASFKYDFKFQNAVFTNTDGSTIKWNSSYTLVLTLGVDSNENFTFTSKTTGSISGTNKDNKSFSVTIKDLFTDYMCQYGVVSGTYLIKTEGHPDATYDFGDGTCDNKATLTISGTSKTFTFE